MSYQIETTTTAEKELDDLSWDVCRRIAKKILVLESNPRPRKISKKLKPPFEGYRLRVGEWRVLYQVDDSEKKVVVYSVRHRSDAYRKR